MRDKGFFISFEGGEGTGKTTLIKNIEETLLKKGHDVVVTREPGGSDLGEKIRSLLLDTTYKMTPQAELCLFLASRSQHLSEKILPALAQGKIVLCDRFNDSSIAYQGHSRNMGMEKVSSICDTLCEGITPNLTFFLDLNPEKAFLRLEQKHDRIESEKGDFHQKVYDGYIKLSKLYPDRIKVIDASLSKEEVFEKALEHLKLFQLT